MTRCDWAHPTLSGWQCTKAMGHSDDHLMVPTSAHRHTFCSRCGSGPLLNDPHFDGITCGDCGRRLTDTERERIG